MTMQQAIMQHLCLLNLGNHQKMKAINLIMATQHHQTRAAMRSAMGILPHQLLVVQRLRPPQVHNVQTSNRGPKNTSMMGDLLIVMGEMVDAIKNPTYQTESLYAKVMKVEGFDEQVLIDVFDYLQLCGGKSRGFIAMKMALLMDWIEKYLFQME